MNDVFFTFRSVTAAMRGSRLLADQSIRSLTVRTPKLLQEQGCGYSLRIRAPDAVRARQAFEQAQLRYSRNYRRGGDGQWQEVTL